MYDAIVVGARCAGASTAMLLARKGMRVLLVDRSTFPSEIPHGHFIHRGGPARLQRWGLLQRIRQSNCPAITSVVHDFGDFPLIGRNLSVNGVGAGYGPRRAVFDKILVDAAVEAGAELRLKFSVDEFMTSGDRITGVRGHGRGGTIIQDRAVIVIGADGRNSKLAQVVDAPVYDATQPLTCWYWSYWSGMPSRGLEVYVRGRCVTLVHPTNDGLTAIFVGRPAEELMSMRMNIERGFMSAIHEIPDLADRVRIAKREERFLGATDLPNFARKPGGHGWALVGDAGCHKDPYLALGIRDALRDAELLAEAIDDALCGRVPFDRALEEYQRHRDAATMSDYRQNLERAQFSAFPADLMQLRRALRDNPEDTTRFFLADEEMTAPSAFFNPENLQRIVT
ncbi:MAG TPA: NAD(P)/FAD-dependent oxidoreductase [Gemmatimonadaceae bacterium]|nr:NAD(P)/FAD-dependent oxidoreductase [Gemmatimonadaceae bacterium]